LERSIPFNQPCLAGKELEYVRQAVDLGKLAGDGEFARRCAALLEERFQIAKVVLTNSCTAALEMAALLCDLAPGDEVLLPSFTFVSTANAVVRCGATPVFVDIRPDTLNLDESLLESLVSSNTRAIFPVHYAGIGCAMDAIAEFAAQRELIVVEDAAQAVHASWEGRALGSFGHLAAFSFHETKNFICGEGGALAINDSRFFKRAEILRDKGTDRQRFFRGEVDKYTWVDTGSSYTCSELGAAFLYGQLEQMDQISARREAVYQRYRTGLAALEAAGHLKLPLVPENCQTNFHMFYLLLNDQQTRDDLLEYLREQAIHAVFHYVPLHSSPMGRAAGKTPRPLPVTEMVSNQLLRLPLFPDLSTADQHRVIDAVHGFFER
tara:strand:- start:1542 stop:2681 length:1140 start_codon:yes stop_codon:yes gene_type:complete